MKLSFSTYFQAYYLGDESKMILQDAKGLFFGSEYALACTCASPAHISKIEEVFGIRTPKTVFQRRLETYAAYVGSSISELIKARKAYLSCDSCEVVNGELPIEKYLFDLGQATHLDVYGGKEIKMYSVLA